MSLGTGSKAQPFIFLAVNEPKAWACDDWAKFLLARWKSDVARSLKIER